ncbi:MAG: Na+/H+ antiporter NhaA [Alphaproteobacteria bacterium]|jgi:NhaA family Na+:H+ antiporter
MAQSANDNTAIRASIVLLAATCIALVVANSGLHEIYQTSLKTVIGTDVGPFDLSFSVKDWIKNGLMAIFFLYVGLEIKWEFAAGSLSEFRSAVLPFVAAAGGMLMPAIIYLLVTDADPALIRGWAIPAATDIAFAIGVVGFLGNRVPATLRAFLLALAVIDDLGAIMIVAIFFSGDLQLWALAAMAVCLAGLWALSARNDGALWKYAALGILLWLFTLQSGINATLAGVVTALFIPLQARASTPLKDLMARLAFPVSFGIMPLFAFANAGIPLMTLSLEDLTSSLAIGVAAGLIVGKPLGVMLATWGATRTGIAQLPQGSSWVQVLGAGCLAGIGFTMSLFIGALAFADENLMNQVKVGVIGGSIVAALMGITLLTYAARLAGNRRTPADHA